MSSPGLSARLPDLLFLKAALKATSRLVVKSLLAVQLFDQGLNLDALPSQVS